MRILVFGAHPDDMEIGMGGTIAKYVQKGHDVLMVLVTTPNMREIRLREAQKAAQILGGEFEFLDFNPEDLIFSRRLVRECDRIYSDFIPDVVYTQWNHDSHQDHIAVANSVIAATRKNSSSLYMYEQTIPGGIVPYGFRMQSIVDISEFIDNKIESIRAHQSQLKLNGERWLHGIKGRAAYRGYQIGSDFAECFEVVKEIQKF